MRVLSRTSEAADFADVYKRYRAALFHFCLARTGDAVVAEDITHDVFLKALGELPRFDRTRPFWPWLKAIASRRCIDAHRRSSYAQSRLRHIGHGVGLGVGRQETNDVTATAVLHRLEHAQLEGELSTLPRRQRITLQLFALDGWTYAEIAAHLDCSVSTVKALIVRARIRLRRTHRSPVAVALGGMRALQRRLAEAATRGQSALSLVGATVGAWAQGVATAVPALALMAGTLQFMAPASAMYAYAPPAPDGVDVASWVDTSGAASAPSGPHAVSPPRPSADVALADEPAYRPYQAQAERVVHEALEPFGPQSSDAPGEGYGAYMVASPAYEEDHTLFMIEAGSSRLLTSRDGGASWTRLRALGLQSARRLLFPPAYPKDPRVFAIGNQLLQMSRDGGATFETLAAGNSFSDGAISPAFNAGDPSILLVNLGRLYEYRDDTGTLTPLSLEGNAAEDIIGSVRYAPGYPVDPTIVLTAHRFTSYQTVVDRCTRSTDLADHAPRPTTLRCESVGLRDGRNQNTLTASILPSGPVFVPTITNDFYVSFDNGRTFGRTAPVITSGWIADLALDPSASTSRGIAAVHRSDGPTESALVGTDDGGRSWRPIPVPLPAFASGAIAVVVTPTGRIIALPWGRGVACSEDSGRTWAPRCPTPDNG